MTKPVSALSAGIKYGAMAALVSVAISLIIKLMSLDSNMTVSVAGSIMTGLLWIGGMVLAHKEYKAANRGTMSFGKGFTTGIMFTLVFAVIASAFAAIYIGVIDPNSVKRQMETQIEAMEERGMTDEEIDQTMALTDTISSPLVVFFTTFFTYLIIGAILAAIVSAITKKEPSVFD